MAHQVLVYVEQSDTPTTILFDVPPRKGDKVALQVTQADGDHSHTVIDGWHANNNGTYAYSVRVALNS